LAPGQHQLGFSIRGVLFDGPPVPINVLTGSTASTVRLTNNGKSLHFSPPQPRIADTNMGFAMRVGINTPETKPVTINLASLNARVTFSPSTFLIAPGDTASEQFLITGSVGGEDIVTATAEEYLSQTLAVTVRPVLSSLSPPRGPAKSVIDVRGMGFSQNSKVFFNNGIKRPISAFESDTELKILIPDLPPGPLNIKISVNDIFASGSGLNYEVMPPPPTITQFSPAMAFIGDVVVIHGTYLGSTNQVFFFEDVPSSIISKSDTQLEVIVPEPGQHPVGHIIVDTSGGRASEWGFRLIPQPGIESFMPMSGKVGTPVQLTGKYFRRIKTILFNNTPALFAVHSDTSISTTVPKKATTGPLWIGRDADSLTGTRDEFHVEPESDPVNPQPTIQKDLGFLNNWIIDKNGNQNSFLDPEEPFSVVFQFAYNGNQSSGDFKIHMTLSGDSHATYEIPVPSINPGYVNTASWRFPNGLPAGSYTVDAFVDYYSQVAEVNEFNNQSSNSFTVG
jgi:hypothetical protein